MTRFSRTFLSFFVLLNLWDSNAVADEQAANRADALFDIMNVIDVEIRLSSDQWQIMQPPEDTNWDIGKAFEKLMQDAVAGGDLHSADSSRPGLAGYMGIDHQYGKGNVIIDGESVSDVGVRFKGNGTFAEGHASGKYSFKIDFNEYVDGQEFRGLKKINLHSCISDPSMMREALSLEIFREAGIPASRTSWAHVYLTVPGTFDRHYRGLFEVVEQIDKRFLKDRYGNADGLLLKPSTFGAFRYFEEGWERYERAYVPKTDATPEQQQHVMDFAKLVHTADDETFADQVEQFLDVDQFLQFLALNALLSNLDSFLGGSQNYYAYLEPESGQVQMIPWDMDHSLGAFMLLGTPEDRRNLSINHPQIGEDHKVISRLLNIPAYQKRYREHIEQQMKTSFSEKKLLNRIDELAAVLRPEITKEGEDRLKRFEASLAETASMWSPHLIKQFVRGRHEAVRAQLSGQADGKVLSWEPTGEVVQTWITIGISALVVLMLNAAAWLWGVIAGFRSSGKWGMANLMLYPISPLIFGFYAQKERGRKAAVVTLICSCLFIAVLGIAFSAAQKLPH